MKFRFFRVLEKPEDKPVVQQLEEAREQNGIECVSLQSKGDQYPDDHDDSEHKLQGITPLSYLFSRQIGCGQQEYHAGIYPTLEGNMGVRVHQVYILERNGNKGNRPKQRSDKGYNKKKN